MISKLCKFSAFNLEFQKIFSRSLEQFFLNVGQNNFGNKIPLLLPVSLKVRYHLRCESLCDEKPFTTILPDQRQILDDAKESQCTLHILLFDDFSFFLHLILNIHMKILDFLSKKPKSDYKLYFLTISFRFFFSFVHFFNYLKVR